MTVIMLDLYTSVSIPSKRHLFSPAPPKPASCNLNTFKTKLCSNRNLCTYLSAVIISRHYQRASLYNTRHSSSNGGRATQSVDRSSRVYESWSIRCPDILSSAHISDKKRILSLYVVVRLLLMGCSSLTVFGALKTLDWERRQQFKPSF
ncbi:uncharacterized protein BDW70DRAFT_130914 [Aspergillus foveolatus]|uniref:uncharacterized protein n=1 Tax=Aspergillus foveolatus TaxID=210207 RepID=UPI003CCE283A